MHGVDDQLSFAEFAGLARNDRAAKRADEVLHPVTDAEYRLAGFQQLRRQVRRIRRHHALGPASKDERARIPLFDFRPWRIVGQDFGVDVLFAHAPGDELAVLRAEVEDDDGFLRGLLRYRLVDDG